MPSSQAPHWNKVYNHKASKELGWYESHPELSLNLIKKCQLPSEALILIAGAGTTTLVDALIDLGFSSLIACDLSAIALKNLQTRLGVQAQTVDWIVDDLSAAQNLDKYASRIDLWQDRAVLHFLLTEPERTGYLKSLKDLLKPGGFALIACFAPGTVQRCSGLPIRQYSAQDLSDWLGSNFKLIESHLQTYTQPSGGQREFTHALFQRIK
jgi:EEF1A lysine methyltransferase 2